MGDMRKGTQKRAARPASSTVVCASLPAADLARLDAYGEHMRDTAKLEARRGTLLLMLARMGLDVVERTAAS